MNKHLTKKPLLKTFIKPLLGLGSLFSRFAMATLLVTLAGCLGMPKDVEPVDNFELQRYLGKWYEIARLDHSFERGLEAVTAEYSMREDGGVRVINRGYSPSEDSWEQAEGRAYFVDGNDTAYLKVSFFGPFYGSYVVFNLDKDNYQYAFVSGPDNDYLWLLARTPTVPDALINDFVEAAQQRGFDSQALIFVNQSQHSDTDPE